MKIPLYFYTFFIARVSFFLEKILAVNPNRHFFEASFSIRPSVNPSKVSQSVKSHNKNKRIFKNHKQQQQRGHKKRLSLSNLSVLKDELLDDQRRLSREKKKKKKKRRKRRCVTNTTSARRKDADEATKGEEEEEEVPREC